jgi:rubredoxin
MEKTWRCTVCGYLHKGDSPPDICPVCGAEASKFELVDEGSVTGLAGLPEKVSNLLKEMTDAFVPHAVATHFPCALVPTALLFLALALLIDLAAFEDVFFALLIVAVLTVPSAFGTGIYDWKKRLGGRPAPIIKKKTVLGLILFVLGIITVLWRWQDPQLLKAGGWPVVVFILLLLAMLGCVTLLGHYGSLLVFGESGKRS